ncbi:DUF4440 domain-containing protein [Paucibacter sp. APW11]|uniref:DUF4440 domain-containing protein n=1 Tax=Roseateles aquae TaxID=3077235 RepID=A0ABU3PFK2_9BURK|nr:DUF4440 domain-containing protein [Paucibacter sp. APW11]MDT9000691.1 DUF4440 domain-containing protein [Paucibacter sp. APW11]
MQYTLFALEQELALVGFHPGRARLDTLIADDFVEHGASGRIWTKPELLDTMSKWPVACRQVEDFSAQPVAEDLALVRYRCERLGRHSLRASLWRRGPRGWQIIFHQGTPLG